MKPYTLQSLSVGLVFLGLFLTALGGFGAFHFGKALDRTRSQDQMAAVQTLAEVVINLQEEQQRLRGTIAAMDPPAPAAAASEKAPAAAPPPAVTVLLPMPSIAPPLEQNPPPSMPSLAMTPPPTPDILLPHLPPIAQGPAQFEIQAEPPPPAIKPPRLQLPDRPAPKVATPTREEGPLGASRRAHLVRQLRAHPYHGLSLRAAAENARSVKLALALKSVFREAGWGVPELEMASLPAQPHALLLSSGVFPPPTEFAAAYTALEHAGFLVSNDLDPNLGSKRVVISVGPIP